MMLSEFEQRTGFYPTLVQYEAIERAYMEFDGDKDAFCKAYKKNAGGIAERIQREVNMDTFRQEREQAAEIVRRDAEIERLTKAGKGVWVIQGIGSTVVIGRDRQKRKSRTFTQYAQATAYLARHGFESETYR